MYARKVRFLYEDCMKTLSRLNALSRAQRQDRNLLPEKPEGGRDARATMTMAYDGDILARPEFEHMHVSQAYDSQAFHMVASEQLEDAFDVAGGAAGDRFTVRDDDRINLLELQMPVDEDQARMDEQYEYEFAMRGDDGRRISIQEKMKNTWTIKLRAPTIRSKKRSRSRWRTRNHLNKNPSELS